MGQSGRVNILGVGVDAVSMHAAVRRTEALLAAGKPGYVCVTGVHGIIEAQKDPAFRAILNSSAMTTPDGMPTVWIGRARGHAEMERVYGPDYMLAVCADGAARGCRHFLYGGREGVVEELRASLERRFPGIRIAGTYTPPFRPLTGEEQQALERQVRASGADILWCGLSTPKQERFMAAQLGRLPVTLMVGVGAAFDILSGRTRDAPGWIKGSGLQWLYRLAQEPRRLWRRYSTIVPRFAWLVLLDFLGLRRRRVE